jgi:hypothetical protein
MKSPGVCSRHAAGNRRRHPQCVEKRALIDEIKVIAETLGLAARN